jgi:hypothetical protein
MTQPASDTAKLQALRERNALIRTVRAKLKGRGLDFRELANELVISSPGHPEHGRIYITYACGEVSHRRTVWEYLGHFDGIVSASPDAEPCVDVQAIISILTGRASTPS